MKIKMAKVKDFNPDIISSVQKNFKGSLDIVRDFATQRANPEARANGVAFAASYRKSPESIPEADIERIETYINSKFGNSLDSITDPASKDAISSSIIFSFLRSGIYNAHFLAKPNHEAFLQEFLEQDNSLNQTLDKIVETAQKAIDGLISINDLASLKETTSNMVSGSKGLVSKAKQEIKTREIREEMKQDPVDEKDKKTLKAFKFDSPKLSGEDPGVWGKSKSDESIWMIKKAKVTTEMISSAAASTIGQFFIPEDIAQEQLLTDSKGQIYLASKKINGFETLPEARKKLNPEDRSDIYEWAHQNIDGKYLTSAVSMFLGNSDGHAGNDAARAISENQSRATLIDLGKSMNFTMTNSELAQLSGESSIPDKIGIGENISPADMQRLMHGNFYKMNSPIYLDQKYVDALNTIVAKYEANPEALHESVRKFGSDLKEITKPQDLKPFLDKLSPTATFETLEDDLVKAVQSRAQQTKEYAENISVQMALRDNDVQKLSSIISQNPSILEREIKWLSETNENSVPKNSTIAKRAKETNRSQEILDAISKDKSKETPSKAWTERVGGSKHNETSKSFVDRLESPRSASTHQRG